MTPEDVMAALSRFGITGKELRSEPLTQGLINTAYKILVGGDPRFVLQRLNTEVFDAPVQLMENIQLLLPYLEGAGYTGISLRQTTEGTFLLTDDAQGTWRLFDYVPNSVTVEHTRNPDTARETGRILGRFHQLVLRAPLSEVHVSLPGFHDLGLRYTQLEEAILNAIPDRREETAALIELTGQLLEPCREIPFDRLPQRICHNDTKLSNFLFDETTGRALCLIDLDTLMPGYLLYDFGDVAYDLTRSDTGAASPPETAIIDMQMFEAFLRGLKESGLEIDGEELEYLSHSMVLMPFLHGIRALADYLTGDRYYRISYPDQNLDRAKALLLFSESANTRLPEISGLCKNVLG